MTFFVGAFYGKIGTSWEEKNRAVSLLYIWQNSIKKNEYWITDLGPMYEMWARKISAKFEVFSSVFFGLNVVSLIFVSHFWF